MEISLTQNGDSVFPNTMAPGRSNVSSSKIECTVDVGGGLRIIKN
jgi:hypothetical protein